MQTGAFAGRHESGYRVNNFGPGTKSIVSGWNVFFCFYLRLGEMALNEFSESDPKQQGRKGKEKFDPKV